MRFFSLLLVRLELVIFSK